MDGSIDGMNFPLPAPARFLMSLLMKRTFLYGHCQRGLKAIPSSFKKTLRSKMNAVIRDAWRALIRRLTDESSTPDNKPMPMVLEEWPGSRWFRDLDAPQGHLWGFVQVIKPPTLIEIQGPMLMSYAVAGHIQFRLEQISNGTDLSLKPAPPHVASS